MKAVLGLVLYGRPGCHLCDEMADDIAVTLKSADYHLRIENVDTQADWREAYGPRVPVLTDESGTEICAVRLDEGALRAAVKSR